jgi:nitric oxide reductase NorQ protein
MESNPHTETRLTEEALKRKLKERLEAMSASKTKRKIAAAKTETTPSSPTSSDDMLELIKASGPAADAKPEVKPPFTSTKYIKLNGYFRVSEGVYAILKRNIVRSVNTLLLGPTGVGKTELVSNIAKDLGVPLTIFDMGTMTDPIMSLVGNHVIKMQDGVTTSTFVKSRFSDVIQQPGIVMLDEISRAVVTSNNLLFPCLDFRRELPMEYCFDDVQPIKVHPQCVFIATANLGGQYTGTHKLDRALLDRFMIVEIDPLSDKEVRKAINTHCPSIESDKLSKMIRVYSGINKAHNEFTVSFNLSIRHLKMIGELVEDGFTLYDAFYIICKGIGGTEGAKFLETLFDTAKPTSDETTKDDDEEDC